MNILELAKEAGISPFWAENRTQQLKRFAALVRLEALEEAANVCESKLNEHQVHSNFICATSIRKLK